MAAKSLLELEPEGGWKRLESARLQPLENRELGLFRRFSLFVIVKVGKAYSTNLFRTFFRNFRVYFPFARFNAKLMPKGQLPRRQTELALLRVGWLTRSYYEWSHHCDIGMRAGLTVQDICRVTEGPKADGWSDSERAILTCVDELIADHQVSGPTWQHLREHLDEALLIELLFLIATYTGLASVLNSVGVRLEPGIENLMTRARA
jgi:alkylhydroperoxidase family enzyme